MNYNALLGNLVREPEIRTTSSGPVVSATIAVNRRKADNTDHTSFIDLTIWGKRGEAFAKYHHQGDKVLVEGYLEMDSWVDKATGGNRTKLKVVVTNWEFVKAKDEEKNF